MMDTRMKERTLIRLVLVTVDAKRWVMAGWIKRILMERLFGAVWILAVLNLLLSVLPLKDVLM